jgi:hypothetical protein
MGESELEGTYGSSVNARMAARAGEGTDEPVDDLSREPIPGDPPVPGAQWDEVHRRWEVWDEAAGEWRIAGDDRGDSVAPSEENPLPSLLARELQHGEELEAADETISDVPRASPTGPAPRGAQWNEIDGRWERWDEATGAWVEATVDAEPTDPA